MREILFKAKRWSDGKWVFGDLLQCQDIVYIQHYINGCRISDEVDLRTVCQYTGLKDKNGVRIWDGDKCLFRGDSEEEYTVYVVFWDLLDCRFCIGEGEFGTTDCLDTFFSERCEVIGNIHDKDG